MQTLLHPLSQISEEVPIQKVSSLSDGRRTAHSLKVVVDSAGRSGELLLRLFIYLLGGGGEVFFIREILPCKPCLI